MRKTSRDYLIKKNFYECTYYVGENPYLHEGTFYYDEFGYWCHEDNVMLIDVIEESVLRVLKEKDYTKYLQTIKE